MFLLRDKMIMQGEKRETSTQTCNEAMLTRQVEGFCISYLAAFNYGARAPLLSALNIKPSVWCKTKLLPAAGLQRFLGRNLGNEDSSAIQLEICTNTSSNRRLQCVALGPKAPVSVP